MSPREHDTNSDDTTDETTVSRRAFGIGSLGSVGSLVLGSGTFTIGYTTNRSVTPDYEFDEFELVRARIHDESLLKGFETYVYGEFEEHVSDEPVTVTIYSEKEKQLFEETYHVSGTAWRRIPTVRRYPDTVVVSRG